MGKKDPNYNLLSAQARGVYALLTETKGNVLPWREFNAANALADALFHASGTGGGEPSFTVWRVVVPHYGSVRLMGTHRTLYLRELNAVIAYLDKLCGPRSPVEHELADGNE